MADKENTMLESSPFKTVQELTGGYIPSRCLHIAADMGVADALDETPRTAAEIAPLVGAHPDALGRVMSILAAHGIFDVQGDTFRHTDASRLLRSDHPQSMRAFVQLFGMSIMWDSYGAMDYTIRTGLSARDTIIPEGFWTYLAEHPEKGDIFNKAMTGKAQATVAGVTAAYDFSGFGLIGDIGGGLGHLLRGVIAATPNVKGILFDLPSVINRVQDMATERLTFQAGDFFSDALPVCDAYMMMDVIHDWADEPSIAILKGVRRAAPPHAKLLVIEAIIPDEHGPHWAKVLDIHMMVLNNARQRTLQEFKALLEKAGFSFVRQIDTGTEFSIIEAIPA
jgi:hypothetical protein